MNYVKLEQLINNWYFDTNDIDKSSNPKEETSDEKEF
jgi:hypothetical protein